MVRRKEELKNSVGPKFGYEHLIAKTAMIGENRHNVLDHRYRKHRKSQLYPGTKKTNSSLQDDDDDMETDEDGFIPPKQVSPSSNGFISWYHQYSHLWKCINHFLNICIYHQDHPLMDININWYHFHGWVNYGTCHSCWWNRSISRILRSGERLPRRLRADGSIKMAVS